ncbi:MAG: nickel pincer cofactor biosynthesis protein LarC [Desulfatibacillaceae bacterium]
MIAYFDCIGGVSGDMCLGALADLGVDMAALEQALAGLPLSGFRLEVFGDRRHGIHGTRVVVHAEDDVHSRDHAAIRDIVNNSGLPGWVRDRALAVFDRLARAEAGVHGTDPEHVHFHEVGGIDAIVDVCGTLFGLHHLGVSRVFASAFPLGSGFVKCAHGTLPVPAPATVRLLEGCPTHGTGIPHELVTPTGAAILSTLAEGFGPPPAMEIAGTGYGIGTRELDERPNCLRVILGRDRSGLSRDRVCIVGTNIDDMNPEHFGHLSELLFEAGALDVLMVPAYMKKGRPGVLLEVVCPPGLRESIAQVVLTETTTIGVRYSECERRCLGRERVEVDTPWGRVAAKKVRLPGGGFRVAPEYEECRRIAGTVGVSLREVYEAVIRAVGP